MSIDDSTDWLLLLIFDSFFLIIFIYLVIKRLIPALKNKTALEINCWGIISATKNVKIYWADIEDIQLGVTGRTSTYFLQIKYKKESQNKRIKIPLLWVSGNDKEIYNSVLEYWKSASSTQASTESIN